MITMDVKGIKWVGSMYQKFENMFLEAEDVMYEDGVKYIENQMHSVGESVKKIYSDIMEVLLPPDEKVGMELLIDKRADAGFCKEPFQAYKERHVKSNLGFDENPVNRKMAISKITDETTLAETDARRTSRSCEISNENQIQNHGLNISRPVSVEVARLASDTDCSNEIENASTKQFPNDLILIKLAEEKQIGTSFSYCVLFGKEVEQGHETMQQDHLKLEEGCVMVNEDEIQFPSKACGSLNTNKWRQTFYMSTKSARKQEYKELAAWHMNSEKVKGDCMENLDLTLPQDQKKLLISTMSEPEWELL